MNRESKYIIRVVSDESANVEHILRQVCEQSEQIDGIQSMTFQRSHNEGRDIGEVLDIIEGLDDEHLSSLEDAIDSYTEDKE